MGEKKTEIDIYFDFTTDTPPLDTGRISGTTTTDWVLVNVIPTHTAKHYRNITRSSGVKNSRMESRWN